MITFITTTKKFEGLARTHQLNAINSWLSLHPAVEVVLFHTQMEAGFIDESRIRLITEMETSESGVPLINYMFGKGSEVAKHNICCFVNADIILLSKFLEIVNEAERLAGSQYLMFGQRLDFDLEKAIEFSNNSSEPNVLGDNHEFDLHPPTGSDFFVFPKGQYAQESMPQLLVGRPGWDLWMAYHARKMGFDTIDLSPSVLVYHQNHDYSHKTKNNLLREKEDWSNYQHLPKGKEYSFKPMYTANLKFVNGALQQNKARGSFHKKAEIEHGLYPDSLYWKSMATISNLIQRLLHRVGSK